MTMIGTPQGGEARTSIRYYEFAVCRKKFPDSPICLQYSKCSKNKLVSVFDEWTRFFERQYLNMFPEGLHVRITPVDRNPFQVVKLVRASCDNDDGEDEE